MFDYKMSHSKYSIKFNNPERASDYRILRCGTEDITESVDNNIIRDLILEIDKLNEENKYLKEIADSAVNGKPAVMTSSIGDLTIDAEGMRKAIDHINNLETKLRTIRTISKD